MKLGIIAPSHDENGIRYVASLGLSYAEFDVNGDDVTYIDADAVASACKKHGVSIGAVGRWGRPRINCDGSVNKKEQNDEFLLIDLCKKIGCPVYICGVNYIEEISLYSNYTAAIGYIQSLIDYAGDGLKICTYNCHWHNFVFDKKAWEVVHGHIPSLGIKFDPSHSVNGNRDYLCEAVEYGDRVYHIHLKGTVNVDGVRIDDPPAGLDGINWGALLSVFAKHGYDGMLSIEPHSATWQGELGEKGVKYTVEYFKKMPFVEV